MTISQSCTGLAASAFLPLSCVPPTQSQTTPQIFPAGLLKAVIGTELNTSKGAEMRWKYRLDKESTRIASTQRTSTVVAQGRTL